MVDTHSVAEKVRLSEPTTKIPIEEKYVNVNIRKNFGFRH